MPVITVATYIAGTFDEVLFFIIPHHYSFTKIQLVQYFIICHYPIVFHYCLKILYFIISQSFNISQYFFNLFFQSFFLIVFFIVLSQSFFSLFFNRFLIGFFHSVSFKHHLLLSLIITEAVSMCLFFLCNLYNVHQSSCYCNPLSL